MKISARLAELGKLLNVFSQLAVKNKEKNTELFDRFNEQLQTTLTAIKEEACQTPAGTRWYKGQLQINKMIHSYFDSPEAPKKLNDAKNTQDTHFIFCTGLYKELDYMIASGKDRYISA